jgi:hypothetical protein
MLERIKRKEPEFTAVEKEVKILLFKTEQHVTNEQADVSGVCSACRKFQIRHREWQA